MDVRKIGAFISELRKSKNLTQAELAQLLNVSHQAVSKWERGESLPDIGLLPLTAKVLELTVDELLSGERIPAPVLKTPIGTPAAAAMYRVDQNTLQVSAEDTLQEENRLTFDHVSSLAPFLSWDALQSMVEQVEDEVHWDNVEALAPFLGRDVLEKLVEQVIDGEIEMDRIKSIAPFLGHEALERLVNHAEEESLSWDAISGLVPFLSRETLSIMVQRVVEGKMEPENIMGLAPFLDQSDLEMLIVSRGISGLRPEHLAGLAPFLSQSLLEKLVFGNKREVVSEIDS
ncbi:helix-turn-helix domain-containing protein [Paenibacillus nasutitermitis]|uniref:HTH cro/C1-type domain-containing protein n=1 Tax=Paenibacillus nasutitermitis TaxID=1652958 RepID=A0A916YRQ6_9BACL|nr:helix-turn-helix transcriptional regulator [Paenibacillus nasutitermitis]GGD58352.1 hypothetical protein GCM10010911_15180 [Paenibacillus nasutitermitis]